MPEITLTVYDGLAPATLINDLPDSKDRTWLDQLNDVGSGSFKIHALDDVFASDPTILAYGNIVRFTLNGTDRFASIIETRELPPASPEEESGRWWTVSGRGVLALLEDAIVYPENVNGSHARQRRFDWTAAAYDDSTWIAATQIQQQGSGGDEVRWQNKPDGWPPYHTGVYWIWSRAKDAPYPSGKMPVGTCYFRRKYTFAADTYVLIAATCDNEFQLFLDGDPILEGQDWTQTFETKLAIGAGVHEFAAVCKNDTFAGTSAAAPGGPAGFLFLMLQLDDASAFTGTPLLVSDSSWLALDYPASVPGMSIGAIWRLLITEAQARGALPGITLGFSDTIDTNGNAWTEDPDIALDIGTTLLDVHRTFSEQWTDGDMTPTLQYNLYNKGTQGTDLTGSVSLLAGQDFEELAAAGQGHLSNGVLARDTTGLLTTQDDATSLASHKRKEAYLELALAPSEARAQAMSTQVLVEFAYPTIALTAKVTAESGPYTTWAKGDMILVPDPRGNQVATNVLSIAIEEDAAGHPIYHAEGAQDDASV